MTKKGRHIEFHIQQNSWKDHQSYAKYKNYKYMRDLIHTHAIDFERKEMVVVSNFI